MSLRVTIVLDENNNTKLRQLQSQKIKVSENTVSFSAVINEVIADGLKKQ